VLFRKKATKMGQGKGKRKGFGIARGRESEVLWGLPILKRGVVNLEKAWKDERKKEILERGGGGGVATSRRS